MAEANVRPKAAGRPACPVVWRTVDAITSTSADKGRLDTFEFHLAIGAARNFIRERPIREHDQDRL